MNEEKSRWTREPPTEQGEYWNWNGSLNDAPVPVSTILCSNGKCVVSMGQLGLAKPVWCEEFGGWWKRIPVPEWDELIHLAELDDRAY